MKIVFDKVSSSSKPFDTSFDGIRLVGTLTKSGYHRVSLDSSISGDIELSCDRCGDRYITTIDNKLHLILSDIMIEDKDDLDIIEFLDGVIDITYIIESEINVLNSTYHYCPKCDGNDDDFEVEY